MVDGVFEGPIQEFGSAGAVSGAELDAVLMVPVEVRVPVDVPVAVHVVMTASEAGSAAVTDSVPTIADDIAVLVLAVPDVVRLHGGRFGEAATYLPGRRITGIRFGDKLIEVHVVVAGNAPIPETAQLIHAAVATQLATPVHVYIEDVAVD